jgi:hypothetical protein
MRARRPTFIMARERESYKLLRFVRSRHFYNPIMMACSFFLRFFSSFVPAHKGCTKTRKEAFKYGPYAISIEEIGTSPPHPHTPALALSLSLSLSLSLPSPTLPPPIPRTHPTPSSTPSGTRITK